MNKILIVARREYLATVRRKSFIILTLGMPVFFLIIAGITAGSAILASRRGQDTGKPIGILDEAGILDVNLLEAVKTSALPQKPRALEDLPNMLQEMAWQESLKRAKALEFRLYPTRGQAQAAFERKDIRAYYAVPQDYLESGKIELTARGSGFMAEERPGWTVVNRWVQASLLKGRVEEGLAERLWKPPSLASSLFDEKGAGSKGRRLTDFLVPYLFMILFLIAVLGSAGYLLQGVAEEKENRVIEILVSSVTPNELLAGKVLGLGAAGLTQLLVWVVIGVLPSVATMPALDLRWSQAGVALLFFLLGFFLFGTLMAGSGALGNNYRESQQLSIIWTISAIVPTFMLTAILQQPNGALARVLSYIPLTAPVTMMIRNGAGEVPAWDIALSAAILGASLVLFIRLGGKLFRLGILMYGKKPSLPEIVRWLRQAG